MWIVKPLFGRMLESFACRLVHRSVPVSLVGVVGVRMVGSSVKEKAEKLWRGRLRGKWHGCCKTQISGSMGACWGSDDTIIDKEHKIEEYEAIVRTLWTCWTASAVMEASWWHAHWGCDVAGVSCCGGLQGKGSLKSLQRRTSALCSRCSAQKRKAVVLHSRASAKVPQNHHPYRPGWLCHAGCCWDYGLMNITLHVDLHTHIHCLHISGSINSMNADIL